MAARPARGATESKRRGRTAAIEALAGTELDRVPDYIWDGHTLPVPVEQIADSHYGLYVREAADLSFMLEASEAGSAQGLSGLLIPDSGEIWVNSLEGASSPGRRRFTISHELGHWCLHRDARGASIYCRSTAVDPPTAMERPRPGAEAEADVFAAAMLMPRHLVRRHYAELGRRPDGMAQMCELFGASVAAMSRRLRSLATR